MSGGLLHPFRRDLFMAESTKSLTDKNRLKYYGPGTLIVVLSFAVAFLFIKPAPPRSLIIGTGGTDGDYFYYAQMFKEILARDGIQLEVRTTGGSIENLQMLKSGQVDIAFMQGGVGANSDSSGLISLGSLYYEPIWVFHRADVNLQNQDGFLGLRIGMGAKGSSTAILSRNVMTLLGISSMDAQFIAVGGSEAADMLIDGQLDMAFMIYGYEAPVIQKMLKAEELLPLSIARAEAFARKFHHWSIVTLPRGIVDFATDIPADDVVLLALTAQLVAPADFHPALIDLFIDAAEEIYGSGGIFERSGEFPSLKLLDFDTNRDIRQFYKSGLSFLRRYLPFWLATFIDRMKIMLVPLVAILFPFFKLMPPLYRYRIRSKIFRCYRELEVLDPELHFNEIQGRVPEYLSRLDQLEEKVSKISVPLGFRESVYNLRMHIDMIRSRLLKVFEAEGGK
jgi:TRAP transporter TAXI family solute receptor